ncbi:MAG: response regulator transcription factor [Arcobacter sp.]|nr:response regulator transcription factor [Arcobacter sp.]
MTPKIKTIIIEDNHSALDYLSSILLSNFNSIKIVGKAESISKAITLINREKPELIFMDIELQDGLAFEIFKQLKHQEFEVIFVTAFDNFIKKAIDHYAFSYIIKPYEPKEIIALVSRYNKLKKRMFSINKLQSFSNFLLSKDSYFLLHVGNKHISIKTSSILKCVADGNYTAFHLNNGKKYLASNSLKYYKELLCEKGFFKAHRSVLVNISYIESIYKKETIILKNNDKIHVSFRNRTNLSNLINSLS